MRCSSNLLALGALAIGQATAKVLNHRHFHGQRSAINPADISKRSTLAAAETSLLTSLGFAGAGLNAVAPNGAAWIGSDGPYTNDFRNNSTEPMILTIWTGATSWVNTNVPTITVSLPPGTSQTISFAEGVSGGFSGVYTRFTKLVYGQISNTWGEFTYAGATSTIDVSREVSMEGRGMRIETPNCVSDMNRCVFVCTGGATTCWEQYELQNCAIGSQPGANYGTFNGMPSGGCTGTMEKVKTFFY